MDEIFSAEHSDNPLWTKSFSQSTRTIHYGRNLFRGALGQSTTDEIFFAEHSDNPLRTKSFSRCTRTIHYGRNLFRGALGQSTMDETRPKWRRTASRHAGTSGM